MLFKDCLCFSLGKVSREMTKHYRAKLDNYGLTQPQFFLLIALYEDDNILISRLAEKVALDKATLTGILDRLERDGYVKRVYGKKDRRSVAIKLTEKAIGLKDELKRIYNETNNYFLSKLTENEYNVFQSIISKLEKI